MEPIPPQNQDPATSAYSYVDNQPTVMVDPSGMTREPIDDGTRRAWLAVSPAPVVLDGLPCIKCIPGKIAEAAETIGRAVVEIVVQGARATLRIVVGGKEIVIQVAKAVAEATAKAIKVVIREAQVVYRLTGPRLVACVQGALEVAKRLPPETPYKERILAMIAGCLSGAKFKPQPPPYSLGP
jgi:hypothetical protein